MESPRFVFASVCHVFFSRVATEGKKILLRKTWVIVILQPCGATFPASVGSRFLTCGSGVLMFLDSFLSVNPPPKSVKNVESCIIIYDVFKAIDSFLNLFKVQKKLTSLPTGNWFAPGYPKGVGIFSIHARSPKKIQSFMKAREWMITRSQLGRGENSQREHSTPSKNLPTSR